MKRISMAGLAAAVALTSALFFGGEEGRPLSMASAMAADCTMLTQQPSRRRGWTGSQPLSHANRTPNNVRAQCQTRIGESDRINAFWEIPSALPTALLTGHCIEITHHEGSETREFCHDGVSTESLSNKPCVWRVAGRERECWGGTHSVRVKFETSCDVDLPWSSGASCTFD